MLAGNYFVYQIITLHTLSLYSVICQLYLSKVEGGPGGGAENNVGLCPQSRRECLKAFKQKGMT